MKKSPTNFLLFLILGASAFFRLYRLGDLLGFWYDQGRDALVIWDLLNYGKFFLIGPVTGIDGIYLGPFYYYLIAPFYWLGKGNPVFPAAGIVFLTLGSIYLIFYLAKKIYNPQVGVLAAFLYGFSYSLVTFSRWLSNPTPLPFFTMVVLIGLFLFINGKKKALLWTAFIIGLCLQLEAASAVFFLPATLAILFLEKEVFKDKRILILSFLAFFITLLPQILFDIRHEGVLRAAFNKFLVTEKSFKLSLWQTFRLRLLTYYDVFFAKLFPGSKILKLVSLASFSAGFLFFRKRVLTKGGKMLAIWLAAPLVGFLFYQGNNGYVWDYYFTGVVPAFIILFAASLGFLLEKRAYQIAVMVFLLLFAVSNVRQIGNYHKTGIGITLKAQKWAIDWIYKDADGSEFNIDAYVPPQIYYSYSYLFKWYGKSKYGREPETNLVKNLYTLYEPDGEHPQFLEGWLLRQDTIGKVVKSDFWGDITVQKRERVMYE
ncbi:hypothetical protein C4578_03990 [Candidatus Microgenomates bacterium]|jgi:4-amino-4-deoxy-L-arabinose transferase-like glycosyltransferase|nr:MAG: hypothetical protein C4578_03990 [Candidatus Microgenomates bacterium]